MRAVLQVSGLLLTCMCLASPAGAQSQQRSGVVSVRELNIPHKALKDFNEGLECLAKKDATGSLTHFQSAIAEYPGYYEAYDRMGAADLQLWKLPEAEQAFRRSIEVSAEHYAHPLLALGAILDGKQKYTEAESVTRKGLALEPGSWTGHYYLALALYGLNRLPEAEGSIRESLRRKSDFPQAYLLLADIHGRETDYRSVVDDLNAYLKLSPDGPTSARAKSVRKAAEEMLSELQSSTSLQQPQP